VYLKTRGCLALLLIACVLGVAGCGESADQRAAGRTVTRFYEALKRHDARTACKLVSPAAAAAVLRVAGEGGGPCVVAFQRLFRDIARSADPRVLDSVPKVSATTIDGNRATVVIQQGYQHRKVGLTRTRGTWRITGSPAAR
jgi:hypothetical protein